MNRTETRLIPLPSRNLRYALVAMPQTAWYWLDDLVREDYAKGGYRELVRKFSSACAASLSGHLRRAAQARAEARMADLYNLANDNRPQGAAPDFRPAPSVPDQPDLTRRMPACYQLFRFLPQATYLTTVWERRNFHLKR